MDRSIQFTSRARSDLDGIFDFVASRDGVNRANYVTEQIAVNIRKLAGMPGMGHRRHDVTDPSVRIWSVFSFLIFYQAGGSSLTVVRIIDGRRDIRRRFP